MPPSDIADDRPGKRGWFGWGAARQEAAQQEKGQPAGPDFTDEAADADRADLIETETVECIEDEVSLLEVWASEQRDRDLDHSVLDRCGNFLGSFVTVVEDQDGDVDWKLSNMDGALKRDLVAMLSQAARTATAILRKEAGR